jgi:hypothetical protein
MAIDEFDAEDLGLRERGSDVDGQGWRFQFGLVADFLNVFDLGRRLAVHIRRESCPFDAYFYPVREVNLSADSSERRESEGNKL